MSAKCQTKKALRLFNITQDDIQDKTCSDSDMCRKRKGGCCRNITFAYGNENRDHPSPDYPLAPIVTKDIYL